MHLNIPLALAYLSAANGLSKNLCGGSCSDNMVLQHDRAVIWGFQEPAEEILTVCLQSTCDTVLVGDDGFWLFQFPPTPPSQNNTITISASPNQTTTLQNVAFGTVILCSGQSNMELELDQVHDGASVIQDADIYSESVRAVKVFHTSKPNTTMNELTIGHDWDGDEATNCSTKCGSDGWFKTESSCVELATMSAICYAHAVAIFNKLNNSVPIGLIQVSWGGTRIESWMSPSAVASSCEAESEGTARCGPAFGGEDERMNSTNSGNLCSANYNGMLHPLRFMQLTAMVWYQGESNLDTFEDSALSGPMNYACRFPTSVQDWRNTFNQQNLPFVYVELAACDNYPSAQINEISYPDMRMAQRSVLTLNKTNFVTAIDLGNEDHGVHSVIKIPLAERVAVAVVELAFDGKEQTSPKVLSTTASSITFNSGEMYFDDVMFATEGCANSHPFEVKINDQWVEVNATIDSNGVVQLDNDRGVEVRLNWSGFPQCSLYSKNNIAPVAPLRMKLTDVDDADCHDVCEVSESLQQCCSEFESCVAHAGCLTKPLI